MTYLIIHGVCFLVCCVLLVIANRINNSKRLSYSIGDLLLSSIFFAPFGVLMMLIVLSSMSHCKPRSIEEARLAEKEIARGWANDKGTDWF